jgi:hypothetical protein
MSYPFPPTDLITLEGVLSALVIFAVVMYYTKKETHSKQSWIPALFFAVMVEILISLIIKNRLQ